MANNNVQNVRFLRNGSLFESRTAALSGLSGQTLSAEQDGSIILARYGSGDNVKTLVGVVYFNGSNKSLTVFDVEGASGDVEALRTEINNKLGTGVTSANTATAQLAALSGNAQSTSAETSVAGAKKYAEDLISTLDVTDTAIDGSYVSQVSEADGKVSVSRVALPDASSVANENKVITDVTQSKGAITATASNITGVKLAGYAEGTDADIAATDTLGEALGKLQAQINAMDKSASAVDGQVVTTVAEEDGKVTETKANVKDLQLGGYAKTNDTGDIASADTINVALSKIENQIGANTVTAKDKSIVVETTGSTTEVGLNIRSGERVLKLDTDATSGGVYTDLNVVKITNDLPAEIKERYELRDSSNVKIGESIDIAKDSHIVSITYITDSGDTHYQNLEYVYIDASGDTKTAYVDMSALVLEAEFASGVTVGDGHVVHGVVDPASESFLTVGTDGFKVAGVQTAIDSAVEALDATGGTQTIATGKHVAVEVAEVDGKITTVTVVEDNIADADDLAELSAKTVTEIASSNASISAVSSSTSDGTVKYDVVTDASKVKMTGFTAAESGFTAITTASTVTEAVKVIETEMISNEQVTSAALNDLNSRIDNLDAVVSGETTDGKVNVKVTETNGVITAVDVVGTDIASANALTAETAARKAVDGQNGDTYAANTSSSYISGATSLNDADVKLDAALKSLSDATVNEVQVNGVALTETSNSVNVQISAVAGTGASATPIVVNTDNSTGAVTIKLEGLDCGTY